MSKFEKFNKEEKVEDRESSSDITMPFDVYDDLTNYEKSKGEGKQGIGSKNEGQGNEVPTLYKEIDTTNKEIKDVLSDLIESDKRFSGFKGMSTRLMIKAKLNQEQQEVLDEKLKERINLGWERVRVGDSDTENLEKTKQAYKEFSQQTSEEKSNEYYSDSGSKKELDKALLEYERNHQQEEQSTVQKKEAALEIENNQKGQHGDIESNKDIRSFNEAQAKKRGDILESRSSNHQKRITSLEEDLRNSDKNDVKKRESLKNKITILNERVRILKERTASLEKMKRRYEERNDSWWKKLQSSTGRNWSSLKQWVSEPGNKKKLGKRILISAGISAGLGALGLGAGVVVGLAGTAGAFTGKELGEHLFNKSKRTDFRREMYATRKKYEDDMHIQRQRESLTGNVDKIKRDSILKKYVSKRTSMLGYNSIDNHKSYEDHQAKKIRRIKRERSAAQLAGGILGGGIARGLFSLDSLIPSSAEEVDSVPEEHIETPVDDIKETPIENPEPQPIEEIPSEPHFEDITIREGEGVTHAFVRQIKNSPELQEYFGLGESASERDIINASAEAARKTGYLSDNQEVRVFLDQNAGYELTLDNEGKLMVNEYKGIELDTDNSTYKYEAVETHCEGDDFEGKNIETEYEYIENTNQEEVTFGNNQYPDVMSELSETPPETETLQYPEVMSELSETPPTDHQYPDVISELSETPPEELSFSLEHYLPPSNPLTGERLRSYGIGSSLSQVSLPESLGGYTMPQKFLDFFQHNQEDPSLNIRVDNERDANILFKVLGVEKDNDLFDRSSFRSKFTGEKLNWDDIYERVDRQKVVQEVRRIQQYL